MNLKDKVVVVTGSSSGIGKAAALLFARRGASVVVNSKSNLKGGKGVVDEIKKNGGQAIYLQANLADPAEVKKFFDEIIKQYKKIDVLINNAGFTNFREFLKTTKEQWLEDLDDNLFTTVLSSQEAAKAMLKQGHGKILNTASIRGLDHLGREGIMPYSAAKAAVINFTKTLAKELAPNIQVNAVAPGFVYTQNYDSMSQELKDMFVGNTYLKRFIKPDEIAEAFLYLATTEAVTGEVLVVDAGYSLKNG